MVDLLRPAKIPNIYTKLSDRLKPGFTPEEVEGIIEMVLADNVLAFFSVFSVTNLIEFLRNLPTLSSLDKRAPERVAFVA